MPLSNFIQAAAKTENTPQLQSFWQKKYQDLFQKNYFTLNSKTLELLEENLISRPATPFGDLVLTNHLEAGEIDESMVQENIETAIRFLDALLDVAKFDQKAREIVNQYRKIGLGVSGFGDYYKQLNREKSDLEEIEYIGNLISNNAYRSSESLSEEKGVCKNWDSVKKILRSKGFEYWYNTETGDIKSSVEMSHEFDQAKAESSDFEIVPRRNSHLLLFPATPEWQVWSDRDVKIEKNSQKEPENNSEVENERRSSNTLPQLAQISQVNQINASADSSDTENRENPNLGENSEGNSNLEDEQVENEKGFLEANKPSFSEFGNVSSEPTVISFPKNSKIPVKTNSQIEKEVESQSEIKSDTYSQNQELETSSSENFVGFEIPQKTVSENDEKLESSDLKNTIDQNSQKDISEEVLENTDTKNAETERAEEKANHDNLMNLEKSSSSIFDLGNKENKTGENLNNDLDDANLAKTENEVGNDLGNKSEVLAENEQNEENLSEENDLQLGQLVRIIKEDSLFLGQIHQIINISDLEDTAVFELSNMETELDGELEGENKNEFGEKAVNELEKNLINDTDGDLKNELDTAIFEEKAEGKNNIWFAKDLESVDLHSLLEQINTGKITTREEMGSKNLEIEKNLGIDKLTTGQKILELTEINESLGNQKNSLALENEELRRELGQTRMENERMSRALRKQEVLLAAMPITVPEQNENKVVNQENLNQANLENLQKELEELKNKNAELTTEIDNKNNEIADKDAELEQVRQNIGQFQKNKLDSESSLENKLVNLQNSNQISPNNNSFPTTLSKNFFTFSNKIISFMSKYSLQLQQLASTQGNFQLGDILITLQYDGSGIKLISASGDKLTKELKHIVDTVLGIVNKALSFGVPAKELASQMKLEPKDDGTETAVNQILKVVATALEEAPEQIQQVKQDALVKIDKADVEAFTKTVKSDSATILKGQLYKLKMANQQPKPVEKSELKPEQVEEKPAQNSPAQQEGENPFASKEDKPQSDDRNDDHNNSQNNRQNNDQNDNQSPSQSPSSQPEQAPEVEEKPRGFFGGFGNRN